MSDRDDILEWRERANAVVRAIVVVTCYVIVFTGLLMTLAGAGH